MANPESSAGTVPVKRAELVTEDMELVAELIGQLYVEHRARFNGGFGYDAHIDPRTDPHAVVVLQGDGVISTARKELYFSGGDAFMPPPDLPHVTRMHDLGLAMVQVPWTVAGQVAADATGAMNWSVPVPPRSAR